MQGKLQHIGVVGLVITSVVALVLLEESSLESIQQFRSACLAKSRAATRIVGAVVCCRFVRFSNWLFRMRRVVAVQFAVFTRMHSVRTSGAGGVYSPCIPAMCIMIAFAMVVATELITQSNT